MPVVIDRAEPHLAIIADARVRVNGETIRA
jgi:hypothetical protein